MSPANLEDVRRLLSNSLWGGLSLDHPLHLLGGFRPVKVLVQQPLQW